MGGHGRWGDESLSRRGFDQDVLKAVFAQPFLKPRDDEGNLIKTPVETKESIPTKYLKVMMSKSSTKGTISSCKSEQERNQLVEYSRKLKKAMRIKSYLRRKRQVKCWRMKVSVGNRQNASSDSVNNSNSDGSSESYSKEKAEEKNEMREMRKLKRNAQQATRKMVENRLAS